jgi:RHS repeat-associated protein
MGNLPYTYNNFDTTLQQTVNSLTTNYSLDLNTGLTQVLSDGSSSYLYGLGRISEDNTDWVYYLTDALGSVRQLADTSATVLMAQSYDPYGTPLTTYGETTSNYGFTGEWTDDTGLQHLRARYLDTGIGRFISRDVWGGNFNDPLSLNRWNYVEGNPVNWVDPSGYIKKYQAERAEKMVSILKALYQIEINKDWGNFTYLVNPYTKGSKCKWHEGVWSLGELEDVFWSVVQLSDAMKGAEKFKQNLGPISIIQKPISYGGLGGLGSVTLPSNSTFDEWNVIHELAHAWDAYKNWKLSDRLVEYTGGYINIFKASFRKISGYCNKSPMLPGCNDEAYFYGGSPVKGAPSNFTHREDFAESVTAYILPDVANVDKKDSYKDYVTYKHLWAEGYLVDYRDTMRWEFVDGLMNGTINP